MDDELSKTEWVKVAKRIDFFRSYFGNLDCPSEVACKSRKQGTMIYYAILKDKRIREDIS